MRAMLLAISLLALAVPAGADHCTTYSTSQPELATNPLGLDGAPTHYFFNDETWCCLFSIWWYEESNGIPGAQRGDEVVDDTCHGMIRPDTIVF